MSEKVIGARPGLDRRGYKQISFNVNSVVITSTMSDAVTSGDWFAFQVVSHVAAVAAVISTGIRGCSLISSQVPLEHGTWISGNKIAGLRLSTNSTGHKIMAYERIVL